MLEFWWWLNARYAQTAAGVLNLVPWWDEQFGRDAEGFLLVGVRFESAFAWDLLLSEELVALIATFSWHEMSDVFSCGGCMKKGCLHQRYAGTMWDSSSRMLPGSSFGSLGLLMIWILSMPVIMGILLRTRTPRLGKNEFGMSCW